MQCKSLCIKAFAECININEKVSIIFQRSITSITSDKVSFCLPVNLSMLQVFQGLYSVIHRKQWTVSERPCHVWVPIQLNSRLHKRLRRSFILSAYATWHKCFRYRYTINSKVNIKPINPINPIHFLNARFWVLLCVYHIKKKDNRELAFYHSKDVIWLIR